MALREELERQGNWLFQRRSYLPLALAALFLLALRDHYDTRGTLSAQRVWELACFSLSLLGVLIRVLAVGSVQRGTSGRNTKEQRAVSLNSTGMYSIVRHPLYLGNFVIWLGITVSVKSWWLVGIVVLACWIYYERIMFAEEAYLRERFGQDHLSWASKTPAFIPNLKRWQPPLLSFSFRNAIRREYSGFFAVVSVFSVLNAIQTSLAEQRLSLDPMWAGIFIFGLVFYLTVHVLKKKTDILVKGIR